VIATELTAQFFDYPGQILQTFTVAAEPTPLFNNWLRIVTAWVIPLR